jgi:hypothetical protein
MKGGEGEREVKERSCRIVAGRTDTTSPLNRQVVIYLAVPVAPSQIVWTLLLHMRVRMIGGRGVSVIGKLGERD